MIEERLERKGTWDRELAVEFGFVEKGQNLVFSQDLMNGDLEASFCLDIEGKLWGQVVDREMGESYTLFRSQIRLGAYASQVKTEYQQLLLQLLDTCFIALPFSKDQSNRLAQKIKDEWGDLPDYPFKKARTTGTFRHPSNQKWYALIVTLKRAKVDNSSSDEVVEVLNLKLPEDRILELVKHDGFYPAYHMYKKNWLTVILDGTVADDKLMSLLEVSRSLVGPKSYRAEQGPDYWVIPANPKVYDIDSEFAENKIVYWPQKSTIQAEDIVAIYVTAPVQAIRYVCRVLGANLENHGESDIPTDKKLMRVELIAELSDDMLPRERMMELGVRAVRGPRRLTERVIQVLTREVKNIY